MTDPVGCDARKGPPEPAVAESSRSKRVSDILNLPNQITFARLVLALAFFVVLSFVPTPTTKAPGPLLLNVGLAMFLLGIVTDVLDGYLARHRHMVTALGRVADPFVDKILIVGAFVYLSMLAPTVVPPWVVVVVVAREFLVTGIRSVAEIRGIPFGADWSGKAKMFLQSITAGWVLFATANLSTVHPAQVAGQVLVGATVLVTVASAWNYLTKGLQVLRHNPSKPNR